LNEVLGRISLEQNKKLQDQVLDILVEGESKNNPDVLAGRTRTNKLVHFTGDKSLIGQYVHVKINDAKTWTLHGEIVTKVEV